MNAEYKNDTNNNDTLKQNQNPGAPATPEAVGLAPVTDPSATSDSSDPIPNPEPKTMPATNPPIQESIYPDALSANPSNTSDPSDLIPNPQAETMPTSSEPSIPAPALPAELFTDNCPASALSDSSAPSAASDQLETQNPDLETRPAQPETQNSELETGGALRNPVNLPKLRRTRPRIGKIASLPDHLRNWVNEQLVQRVPAHFISKQLEREGYHGITSKNVSNWRIGGFQDYLKQTESAAERERRWNSLLALAREEGPAFDAAAMQMAIGQYHEVLCGVQPTAVTALISGKPEYYFRLNTGLAGLMKAYLGLGRLKKISPSSRLNPGLGNTATEPEKKGGLTIEERDEVRRSLGIFPPPPNPQDTVPAPEQPAMPAPTEHVP